MDYITTYNKFSTTDIESNLFILESKGIPNTLKYFLENIMIELSGKTEISINIDESDLKINNLSIDLIDSKLDYYGSSRFGVFTPKKILLNPRVDIYYDFNLLNEKILKKTILHELLHIYEIYQRYKNGTSKKIQWDFINEIQKLRKKFNDKFLTDFIYTIYLTTDQEIGARVAETYSILYDEKEIDKDKLKYILLKSNVWKLKNKIKNFDSNNYQIDYKIMIGFFTELNSIMKKISIKQFKIFKLPKNNNDVDNLLKEYKKFFNKKTIYFEHKLLKIIDEVSVDVNNLI